MNRKVKILSDVTWYSCSSGGVKTLPVGASPDLLWQISITKIDVMIYSHPGVLLPLKFLLLAAASNDSSDVLEHFLHLGSRFLKRTVLLADTDHLEWWCSDLKWSDHYLEQVESKVDEEKNERKDDHLINSHQISLEDEEEREEESWDAEDHHSQLLTDGLLHLINISTAR